MDKNTLNKILLLKNKIDIVRPLASDTSIMANDKRSLAWILFDNTEEILKLFFSKEDNDSPLQ